jgi:hypothetical protein
MKPKEFWKLHPIEFYWIAEVRRPKRMYGNMTEDEVAEIYEETYGERD